MMYLSHEQTSKDLQLKSQMAVSFQVDGLKNTEKIWVESGFFKDCQSDLTISKANFPELTFVYINQGQVSLVNGGEQAIYLEYIICGQIMPIANPDPSINLDTHKFEENQVFIYVPVYNISTGLYDGLKKMLGHITLRGDEGERYYSYGFSKEKSSVLYCSVKDPLPNIFHCTAFKKHHGLLLDENQKKVPFSKLFLYLPATLDRKEEFLQWKDNVHLHPIDVNYEELKLMNEGADMNPALLDNKTLRKNVVSAYYKVMKKMAEVSNQNLIRNSDTYLARGGKTDPDNPFQWIDDSYKQGQQKFQLGY